MWLFDYRCVLKFNDCEIIFWDWQIFLGIVFNKEILLNDIFFQAQVTEHFFFPPLNKFTGECFICNNFILSTLYSISSASPPFS